MRRSFVELAALAAHLVTTCAGAQAPPPGQPPCGDFQGSRGTPVLRQDGYPTNLHPWADRGEQGVEAFCRRTAHQNDFTADQLKALYGSKAADRARVEHALDALTRAGWSLPAYRDVVLGDVEALDF